MNDNMWLHPAVRRNVETLRGFGWRFVDPDAGDLACGRSGVGRLAEQERIVVMVEAVGLAARAAGWRPGMVREAAEKVLRTAREGGWAIAPPVAERDPRGGEGA
jgi:phosphopantothenoylcysteine synthetase/decarboxylase